MRNLKNRKCITIAVFITFFSALVITGFKAYRKNIKIPEQTKISEQTKTLEQTSQLCQTDYTRMVYDNGYYYFQSAADHLYLYRADANGENSTCLVKQVPEELYIVDEWVYFTNLYAGKTLWRVKKEGGVPELVLEQKIERFL